jgi:D-alanyl-D-alanine-carboxypeptidase/D-alanyl-D-alanine-endopeptidase
MKSANRGSLLLSFCVLAGLCYAGAAAAPAPARPAVSGEYVGVLAGALHLKLHITVDGTGAMSGALDSLEQQAMGLACAGFHLDGNTLSFTVPVVHGSWKGTVSEDGNTLTGTWDQGSPMPLTFHRDMVPAARPSAVDGVWLGTLRPGNQELRVQLQVQSDQHGNEFCTLDSLDQHSMGIECANVKFEGDSFAFEVPSIHGVYQGKLAADGNSLTGTWKQGPPLPLDFARQAKALTLPPIAPPVFQAAEPPLTAENAEATMQRDLAAVVKNGILAPGTGVGVSIGVVTHGSRRVFSLGSAHPDSVFEIGSITKTFTALILAQMVQQGTVKYDEPVRALLPPGTVDKPAGPEITLVDLATQHSGLPRMPDNFAPADNANPYADYDAARLYAFLRKQGVGKTGQPAYLYSNLGFGLLGQALAVRSGMKYPELLKKEVIDPMGLKDTTVALSPAQQARFVPGHDGTGRPAHAWDLDALAGAGAIRSTADDMLTWVEANLHPEALPRSSSPEARTLAAAIKDTHLLRADAFGGQKIGLAWHYIPETGTYWHNGATGGFSSYAFFNPEGDYAGIVLLNETLGQKGSYADRIGEHLMERLAGKPAIDLAY